MSDGLFQFLIPHAVVGCQWIPGIGRGLPPPPLYRLFLFHRRWHSFRITLKSTTLLLVMRSSNVWRADGTPDPTDAKWPLDFKKKLQCVGVAFTPPPPLSDVSVRPECWSALPISQILDPPLARLVRKKTITLFILSIYFVSFDKILYEFMKHSKVIYWNWRRESCFTRSVLLHTMSVVPMAAARDWLITLHILPIWHHLTIFCSPPPPKKKQQQQHLAGKQYLTNVEAIK